jgi:hypothetical protein
MNHPVRRSLILVVGAWVATSNTGATERARAFEVIFDRIFTTTPAELLAPGTSHAVTHRAAFIGDKGIQFTVEITGSGVNDSNKYVRLYAAPASTRLVARVGDPLPDPPGGGTFTSVDWGSQLNHSLSRDTGPSAIHSHGSQHWWIDEDSTTLLAAPGHAVPGMAAGTLFANSAISLHELAVGSVALSGTITGPGAANGSQYAVLTGDEQHGLKVAVPLGSPLPGLPDWKFTNPGFVRVNKSGDLAFRTGGSTLTSPSTSATGMWRYYQGQVSQVAIYGQQAPGLPAGVQFAPFSTVLIGGQPMALSDAGEMAFAAELSGPGVTTANRDSFWATRNGIAALLAREGDESPGAPNAVFESLSSSVVINSAGISTFRASLSGPGAPDSSDQGIWAGSPGNLNLVVREDDPVPGLANVRFAGFETPLLNNQGTMAFIAGLRGTGVTTGNDTALFVRVDDEVAMIAREGSRIDVDPTSVTSLATVGSFGASQIGTSQRLLLTEDNVIGFGGMGIVTARLIKPDADFNGDDDVDQFDLNAWRQNFGDLTATRTEGDANLDGVVDGRDFLEWQRQLGRVGSLDIHGVPEPTTMPLLALGACAARIGRGRSRRQRCLFIARRH